MERGTGELSATQEVGELYGIPVVSIATLDHLESFLQHDAGYHAQLEAVSAYRHLYGVRHA
jgi:orotate phosphoribosyltransferase